MKLPVYKVTTSVAPADRIRDLGKRLFPQEDQQISERGMKVELQSTVGSIEVDVGNGGVFASDASRHWQFDPTSGKKVRLVKGREAEQVSLDIITAHGLLPKMGAPFHLKPARTTGTVTAYTAQDKAPREVFQEDTTVFYDVEMDVSEMGLKQKTLPIIGGGGRFSVAMGDAGRLLATDGIWRPITGKPVQYELIPQAKTDELFRELTDGVPISEFTSELAYYSAPAFTGQDLLYPVYVYSGVAKYGEQVVPLRKVVIPATEIGQIPRTDDKQPLRPKNAEPIIRSLPLDMELIPGKTLPPGITLNRQLMNDINYNLSDLMVAGNLADNGIGLTINPKLNELVLKDIRDALRYYSAGTSWIGSSGGLPKSKNNAQGFVNELAAIGWNIHFNWGDANAYESDWRKNDDNWVDAVDFVFYSGHANSNGWTLSPPDDNFLHCNETGGASDLWGANNLEWAVIAACGPLQDALVGSGGDVLSRWRNAFDGLHMLMGYAQVTYDNDQEGKRLVQYAKSKSTTLRQSWFRVGREIQPSGIWVGAYYVGNNAHSTGDDHLWGYGSVSPDIPNPTWRACCWSPC